MGLRLIQAWSRVYRAFGSKGDQVVGGLKDHINARIPQSVRPNMRGIPEIMDWILMFTWSFRALSRDAVSLRL